MASLADLMAGSEGGPVNSQRDDYIAYAQACQERGVPALPYLKWIAAGKPAAPPK